jgi:hypothetical protein
MPRDTDEDKEDQAVLALLSLGHHEGDRTWKAFDWDAMNRLTPWVRTRLSPAEHLVLNQVLTPASNRYVPR